MPKGASWTSEELAILADVYPREGLPGAADALPDRTWPAITMRAHQLGLRSPVIAPAPQLVLAGADLEEAIRLYESGWKMAAIARQLGYKETATTNAVLIALCPRRGHRPAERDAHGHLTPESKERLRYMLKKGLKGVEIQLRLGLSAARVTEERRRYNRDLAARDKALLPPPGAGEQYSGVRVPAARKREVEALLFEGFGWRAIEQRTGMKASTTKRIRSRLVKRLARKGETLPGCDRAGVRIAAAKESHHFIPADSVGELRRRLLAGEPVAHAARAVGMGACGAYRIRDRLRAELAAAGRELPKPIRLGRGAAQKARASEAGWLPPGRMQEFRTLVHEHGHDEAKRLFLERLAQERAAERARPKSFEEQLARVARGEVRVVDKIPLRRPDPTMTLGGVASGAL